MKVAIRRACAGDVDFLVELVTHEDVEPFLAAVRAKDTGRDPGRDRAFVGDPDGFGVFVIEVDGVLAARCASSGRTGGAA